MANVYITIFINAAAVPLGDPMQHTKAVIDGANSDVITGEDRKRRRARLFAESDCYVKWGLDPVATPDNSIPLGAENPEYFDIESGYVITAITR